MKNLQDLASSNFKINGKQLAKVIDNKDPKDRGRLKINIQGITELAEIFPWAETEGQLIGNSKRVGLSSAVEIGTFVYVEFIGGNPSFPLVTGYVRGSKDSSLLHTVKNLDDTIFKTRNDNIVGVELPPLNDKSEYPYNQVLESNSAIIEYDNTKGNERVSIQHINGSYYEIRPDGDVQVKSIKDIYNIATLNFKNYVGGNFTNTVIGNFKETITGTHEMKSGGNSIIESPIRNIKAVTNHTGLYNIIGNLNVLSGAMIMNTSGLKISNKEVVVDDGNVIVNNGDVIIDGISFKQHLHMVIQEGQDTSTPH